MVQGSDSRNYRLKNKAGDFFEAREDEVQIRLTSIAQKISHATNLSAAEASVKAIRSLKSNDLTVKPLQDYFA